MTIEKSLAELERRLASELKAARQRVAQLEQAMERLTEIEPLLTPSERRAPSSSGSAVTARGAILAELEERGEPVDDVTLHEAALRRGWESGARDTLNSLRAELYRMRKAGLIVRLGQDGPYRLRVPSDTTDVVQDRLPVADDPAEAGSSCIPTRAAAGTAAPEQQEATYDESDRHHHRPPVAGDRR